MSTEALAKAFAMTRGILVNVTRESFEKPTPCASWNVRSLANHIVEGSNWFAMCVEAGAAPDPDPTHGFDYAAGNLVESYDAGIKATLAAFGAPGALARMIKLPFGEFPGAAFLGLATNDVFVHGWDLASATGQSTDLDPSLAKELLVQMEASLPDAFRGPDGVAPFGPAVDAPESAAPAAKLAAFLGRRVG